MECFIGYEKDTDFPLENLPFGVFSDKERTRPRPGVALGGYVVDLGSLQRRGFLTGPELSTRSCWTQETLNEWMGCGREAWSEARHSLTRLFSSKEGALRDDLDLQKEILIPQSDVVMHLPAKIGDFTDFYASKSHASNVGAMFRGPENALNPNW